MEKYDLRKIQYNSNRETKNAYFHQWGTRNFLADDGKDFPITIAIIELEDGRVVEAEPRMITFVEKFSY